MKRTVLQRKSLFFGYLKVDDSAGRGLLDTFMKCAEELCPNLADCRGQCYDNGANMKGIEADVQADFWKSIEKLCMCHVPTTH